MTIRACLLAAALAALCLGQPVPADSADGLRLTADSRAADSSRKSPRKSPGLAMALSLVVPGGGQVYTGHYWKAALFAPAELGLAYLALRRHSLAREALDRGDTTAYRAHRDWRTTWLFWTGTVVVFSMADAYISAKMFGFERENRFAAGAGGGRAGRMQNAEGRMQWTRRAGFELGPNRAGLVVDF
ncbi:MAG: DUF5683 domain-containing protein [bacterium]